MVTLDTGHISTAPYDASALAPFVFSSEESAVTPVHPAFPALIFTFPDYIAAHAPTAPSQTSVSAPEFILFLLLIN